MIEGPARLAGIDVDEDLVARLVADTDSGEALPLLAYTLSQLADGVQRGGRRGGRPAAAAESGVTIAAHLQPVPRVGRRAPRLQSTGCGSG